VAVAVVGAFGAIEVRAWGSFGLGDNGCPTADGWTNQTNYCEYDGRDIHSWKYSWKVYWGKGWGSKPSTYENAKDKCSAWGATLVRSEDALDAIIPWTSAPNPVYYWLHPYWIGLKNQNDVGWKWDSGEVLQNVPNQKWWETGKPNYDGRDCAYVHDPMQSEPMTSKNTVKKKKKNEVNEVNEVNEDKVADDFCDEEKVVMCVKSVKYQYFLTNDGKNCEEECKNKNQKCDQHPLEEAAKDLGTCEKIIKSLGVQSNEFLTEEMPMSRVEAAGCTWHPGSEGTGSVQLLTKGNDKPTCNDVIRPGTTRRRVCVCKN